MVNTKVLGWSVSSPLALLSTVRKSLSGLWMDRCHPAMMELKWEDEFDWDHSFLCVKGGSRSACMAGGDLARQHDCQRQKQIDVK